MNRWVLRPTGTFIGRRALIGTSMAMDCFRRTDTLRSAVPLRRSADACAPAFSDARERHMTSRSSCTGLVGNQVKNGLAADIAATTFLTNGDIVFSGN